MALLRQRRKNIFPMLGYWKAIRHFTELLYGQGTATELTTLSEIDHFEQDYKSTSHPGPTNRNFSRTEKGWKL